LKNFIIPEGSRVQGMPKKLGPGNFWKTGSAIVFRILWRSRKCDKKNFFFGGPNYVHTTWRCWRNFWVEEKSCSGNARNGLIWGENE
jgi:hypothetical protein